MEAVQVLGGALPPAQVAGKPAAPADATRLVSWVAPVPGVLSVADISRSLLSVPVAADGP
ncbi:hypothetical protein HTS88_20425, partial [Pseudarthrobacter oxydans]|nr:hypothetical protein [Pseudarthrobacter oxydans]